NGWSNYGKGYAPAKYRVVNGICFLEGLINKGSTTHAATLPSDCRPKKSLVFDANKQDNIDRVDVAVNGAVMFYDLILGSSCQTTPDMSRCVCMHAWMYVCMYACMHACMHACMYVCMYVCM
ncbi:unnamed protein product, partial [Symbiodinium microadriaticum]